MSDEFIRNLTVYVLPVLFAITLHEAAHAFAARYFGDDTSYLQGRTSLNPVKHIDLFGTILIPLFLVIAHSPFLIGYAKPVPVAFAKLRQPKRDMAWVALAGPAANFAMAFLWLILKKVLQVAHPDNPFFPMMAEAGVNVNLLFFAFNLIPLPPLDGGRVLTGLLPYQMAIQFARIERFGFFILIALLSFHLLDGWIGTLIRFGHTMLDVLISPLTFLLT